MSAFGSQADMDEQDLNVRSSPQERTWQGRRSMSALGQKRTCRPISQTSAKQKNPGPLCRGFSVPHSTLQRRRSSTTTEIYFVSQTLIVRIALCASVSVV